jgi:hypothetical protein
MNDLFFLVILIFLGFALGTYLKYTSYEMTNRLAISLTLYTPYILLNVGSKRVYKCLENHKFKSILKELVYPIVNYPLMIALVSEVVLEITARTVVKENEIKKQEFKINHKKSPRKPIVTPETLSIMDLFSIFKKATRDINKESKNILPV